jgi:hypothetical protein
MTGEAEDGGIYPMLSIGAPHLWKCNKVRKWEKEKEDQRDNDNFKNPISTLSSPERNIMSPQSIA